MDLHQLRVFAAVFRNRSFSRASEQIHLTQPTVSDHIKDLEQELGCKLFDRLGRTILPTREAEVLYEHAEEVFDKVEVMREAVGRVRSEVSGLLIMGASTIPGTYVLPRALADFKSSYPSVSFQIVVDDSKGIVDRVAQHDLLCGIVGSQVTHDDVIYQPLMDDELIAVAAPSFSDAGPMSLGDLIRLPLVLREEGSGTRMEIEHILHDRGLSVDETRIAGIFGSTDAVKQAVKAGFGVSILSRVSVADELAYGALREIPLDGAGMKRKFYVVTHRKRTLPVSYRAFIEHLARFASQL
ncbi:MAG TPA: selenium metabolism-associated LysR family transcriptional regulator [Dissulfurispiraceae bacterium]|nr:selenium metabolism-associated LysR family transcriptional regulator [Dissulfurispiraceae bacterium]